MPFPLAEERIVAAEEQLGRRLPQGLRRRLLRENGGEIEVLHHGEPLDEGWSLLPVWDPTSRRTIGRTTNHLIRETDLLRRDLPGIFPEDAVAIAENGGGDYLVLRGDSEMVELWDHETGETLPVQVEW